jgi:hypothetical protein
MVILFFIFFSLLPKIHSPKHWEIQEFGQNCHISAMNFSNFTWSTALPEVFYNNSFVVMSRRLNNDNTVYQVFFRVYPISALFATCSDSRRMNQRKFDTKFFLCNIFIPFPCSYTFDSVPLWSLISAWGLNYWVA